MRSWACAKGSNFLKKVIGFDGTARTMTRNWTGRRIGQAGAVRGGTDGPR